MTPPPGPFQRPPSQAPLGLGQTASDGTVRQANARLAELLDTRVRDLDGEDFVERMRSSLEEGDLNALREVLAGRRGAATVIFPRLAPDQGQRWLELRLQRLNDDAGRPAGGLILVEDITTRRQAEQRLGMQRAYLDSLDAESPVQFFSVDVLETGRFRYAYFNRAFDLIPSFPTEAFRGSAPEELVPEILTAEMAQQLNDLYRDCVERRRPVSFEAQFDIMGPGTWWHTTLTPISHAADRVTHLIGTTVDITDTKRAEAEILDREQRLSALTATTSAFLLEVDEEGTIHFVNRTYQGIAKERVLGTHIADWIPHRPAEEIMTPIRRAFASGERQTSEISIPEPGGRMWHWLTEVQPVGLDTDQPRVLITAMEITDRKEAEEELRRTNAELALLKERIEAENMSLREELKFRQLHHDIVGRSDELKRVLIQAEKVAATDATVMILGETGTGKELLARAIHRMSLRSGGPLISVNCAAIPEALMENELFGSEKGAFTGAMTRHIGHFEASSGGSIFLDEIGDLPPQLQGKLLRVLQDGKVQRLGSTKTFDVDTRVIVATNHDLEERVREGRFREDLFFRLQVFPLHLPPLRERPEDIPLLISVFAKEFGEKMGRRFEQIGQSTVRQLQSYAWPGNIRELRNLVERAVIESSGPQLQIRLPEAAPGEQGSTRSTRLVDVEREHITSVLRRADWRVRGSGGAAELLGLHPSTLDFRMKKLGIRRPAHRARG